MTNTYNLCQVSIDAVVGIKLRETMLIPTIHMMTSSNGNIFRVTGHLCGEFTGPRWIPRTKPVMFSLICVWINDWVNNREAGVLRRYRAHYDVTVMTRYFIVNHNHYYTSLTYRLGRDKMATFLQTFSNSLFWNKIVVLWFLSLFPRVQWTISQNWYSWWLGIDLTTRQYQNQC